MVKRIAMALVLIGVALAMPSEASAQKKSKKQRDVITQEELAESGQLEKDLGSAIRSLRPHFFEVTRGVRSAMGAGQVYPMLVYVDGRRGTGIDDLSSILAKDVKEARFLEPSQSMNAYGAKANGGAIVVKTMNSR